MEYNWWEDPYNFPTQEEIEEEEDRRIAAELQEHEDY